MRGYSQESTPPPGVPPEETGVQDLLSLPVDSESSSLEALCRHISAEDPVLAARSATTPIRRILSEEKAELILAIQDPISQEIFSRTAKNLDLKFVMAGSLDTTVGAVKSAQERGVPVIVLVDVPEWEPEVLKHRVKSSPFLIRLAISGNKGRCDAMMAPSDPSVVLQQLHNQCVDAWRSQAKSLTDGWIDVKVLWRTYRGHFEKLRKHGSGGPKKTIIRRSIRGSLS